MPKTIAKLFRDPNDAKQAAADLKAQGCEVEVIREGADLGAALVDSGLTEEALTYYQTGLSIGGIIVKVRADEAKLDKAWKVLKTTGARPLTEGEPPVASSPGFAAASRMSATNPIDAPMSGDFRRY